VDFLTNVPEVFSRADAPIPSYDDLSSAWQPIGDFPLPGDDAEVEDDSPADMYDEPHGSSSSTSGGPAGNLGIIDWRDADNEQFDTDWLRNQCTKFIELTDSPIAPTEMAATLTSYLISAKSDAELQEQLLNFLGYDSFEFIELLFRNRLRLVTLSSQRPAAGSNTAAVVGSSFTVMTKQDKILQKLQEKEIKKIRQLQAQTGASSSPAVLADAAALAQKRIQQLSQGPNTKLRAAEEMSMDAGWLKRTLPAGTVRKEYAAYDDVLVPPPVRDSLPEEKLVDIESNFPDFAKLVFRGVKRLNRIQSAVFETAFKSNENMLICAPTGAGKTNVALMTMLHEVGQHFTSDGVLRKDEFKMIYIAPMKALAAEMTESFGRRFQPLNLIVRELTGDMQLTKKEIQETQLIITTPEKWDVMTRKSTDNALTAQVKLLIIDEVHLLHEDRGSVIESLVARTLRQVEQTQAMIRIVGLSATLPNYRDVAQFLRVNPQAGLFFFGDPYRPVPLTQNFVGIKSKDPQKAKQVMFDVCFDKIKKSVQQGNQVMVFVHSRKDTVNTALQLLDISTNQGRADLFALKEKDMRSEPYFSYQKDVQKSRNRELRELFARGFGIHHAGMLRADRTLTEKLFSDGMIKVLVCTATLAWGVNLPAHTVIIKGTQVYSSEKGQFVDIGMLDVMQIFGRAGRPQFDTSGEAIMLTSYERLPHYLGLLTHQTPIESTFVNRLADHLNAEIVLGTVNNIQDAVQWLSYTYLHVRMLKNPLAYGITYQQKEMDPHLLRHKSELIKVAAKLLDRCKMIRFDERLGNLYPTDLGRVASHYYIQYETVELFSTKLRPNYSDAEIFATVAQSAEFENIRVREEEMEELDRLESEDCLLDVRGEGVEAREGKVNVLLQAFVSQASINTFSLVSDMAYVAQNAARIFRALFEMALKKNWPRLATKLLGLCKMVDRRMWGNAHPLRQFASNQLTSQILTKLEEKRMSVDRICEMSADELGALVRGNKLVGRKILTIARMFPQLDVEATVQPITRSVLRIHLTLTANFNWNDKVHGAVEPFWIWVEDSQTEFIYHSEYYLLHKKQKDEPQKMTFIVPIQPQDPAAPGQYYIHILSDRWMGSETIETLSFKDLVLPNEVPPHTELLPLQPLPVSALANEKFQSIYPFTHFNPIQTQTFHTLYHTDSNVLVGAPTGSGKTIVSEVAMMKLFRDTPELKVVYIAPLKALVRERMKDWQKKLVQKVGKKMVELTGDYTPDMQLLQSADIILTTPEKWDGISRNWQSRSYVKQVGLIIIDEIHLLGEERGPILEVVRVILSPTFQIDC
jgi:activating signal cointegrator complex subunit 3